MREHVAVDDAVDATLRRERQRSGLDIADRDLVQPLRGDRRGARIDLDAEHTRARIQPTIGGAKRAGAAAHIEHHLCIQRNAVQQVLIDRIDIG